MTIKLEAMINQLAPYLIIGMGIIIFLLFIMVIVLFKAVGRVENKYRKLMRGTNSSNLEEMLQEKIDSIEEVKELTKATMIEIKKVKSNVKECIQKVAIMRYKAFDNVGSDLSFSIAMLDDNDDGIIITGIYGREDSTTYAKPVDKGISRYDLSEEETCVLNEALNKYKNIIEDDELAEKKKEKKKHK